jgi:serine/threonine protein kinase
MSPETERLFHGVVDLPQAQRELYYDRQNVLASVREEVEALLRYDNGADHVLTACVAGAAEQVLQRATSTSEPPRCGPYRLQRLLGRGGMGSVYLGERADGEVEQRVAVKLLRFAGEHPAWRERFLRERQILAGLNHKGVARLLDAGHTADGQPYLAMEYVEGEPVDVYAARLDSRGKLSLMVQVCEAVGYAHRMLVIHRDLKPSNVLVGRDGQPKLLDFGIAKILEEGQDQTQTCERLLTPDYASPEQMRGLPQSTATDIYSLGALLHKLLTGQPPPRQMTRLDEAIPADIGYILRKAVREEPEERYPSVDAFADDLRAYLDFRPVRARAGSGWYRARKFARRYRMAVAATTLTLAGLSAGLYVANRERSLAQRRFVQVRQFANKLIEIEGEIRYLPGATAARARIVSTSLDYLNRLTAEPTRDTTLDLEVAEAYWRIAGLQSQNFGQYADAEASLRKGDAFARAAVAANPKDGRAMLRLAQITHERMTNANQQHKGDEVLQRARETAAQLDRVRALNPAPEQRNSLARLYQNVAVIFLNDHRLREAIGYARRAADIASGDDSLRADRSLALGTIANTLRQLGELDEALRTIREARALVETAPLGGRMTYNVVYAAYWREGVILNSDGSVSFNRPLEAAPLFERALQLAEGTAAKDPNDHFSRHLLASASTHLGNTLRHTDPRRALSVYDHAISRARENANGDTLLRTDEADLLANSSYAARWTGQVADAKQRIDTALGLARELKLYPAPAASADSVVDAILRAQANHYAETSQPAQALAVYRELLASAHELHPSPQDDLVIATSVSRTYAAMGMLLRRTGDATASADFDARRLALWEHWNTKAPQNEFVLRELALARAGSLHSVVTGSHFFP